MKGVSVGEKEAKESIDISSQFLQISKPVNNGQRKITLGEAFNKAEVMDKNAFCVGFGADLIYCPF